MLREGGGVHGAKEHNVAFSRMRLLGFVRHVHI